MEILSNWELTRKLRDLARKCKCSAITIIDVADVVPDLSQPNTFQILTNGEVWFVACNGESVIMDSGPTTVVSADANNDITIGSDGGAFLDISVFDTNFFVTNITQTANRTHDQANFTTTINNVNSFTFDRGAATLLDYFTFDASGLTVETSAFDFEAALGADSVNQIILPSFFTVRALDGINIGLLQVEPELIEISSTGGGDTSTIQLAPAAIQLNTTSGIYYLGDQAGGNLPPTEAAPDWILLVDANGALEKITPTDLGALLGGGDVLLDGNTEGAVMTIGTNDDFDLNLETSGVERLNVTGGATTGGAVTITNVTANTSTVQDVLTLRTNSTGTPTASSDFGPGLLFQGETLTVDNREMVRLSSVWTNSVDANRGSALVFANVSLGGALTERFRFTNSTMLTAVPYTIGGSSNQLTFGGSSGAVIISSSHASGITLTASSTTTGNVTVGTTAFTSITLAKEVMDFTDSYTVSSGTGTFTAIAIDNIFNLTGTASGIQRGIHINPTLTSLTAATYRGIDIANDHANSYGIYQSGALTQNFFAGPVIHDNVVRLKGYTVATLPATPVQGDTAFVTDATAPTYLGTAVGGGAVVAKVFFDGTNWIT